jgi:hypothetical protein
MTLPPSGYHARAVTFGCMAKGKGVSSRASLIIYVKVLVGNTVSSSHHAKAVSSSYPLNKKKNKKRKQIKERIKARKGLEKVASMTGAARLLQRNPQVISCIPSSHSTGMSRHTLATSPHLHGLDETPWKLSFPYGYLPNRVSCPFSQPCIVGFCRVFELLNDISGFLCICLIILMMKCD